MAARNSKRPRKQAGRKPTGSDAAIELGSLRADIDAVDEKLHELLNQRARLAQSAGISKHQDGHTVDFYRPEREAEVLRRRVLIGASVRFQHQARRQHPVDRTQPLDQRLIGRALGIEQREGKLTE